MGRLIATRRPRAAMLLALALGSAAPSCVSAEYRQQRTYQEPARAREAAALPPGTGLGTCLELLGAPVEVQEEDDGDGLVLVTWAWHTAAGWGAGISIPLGRVNASFNYDRDAARPGRLRMRFDQDWRLVDVLRD